MTAEKASILKDQQDVINQFNNSQHGYQHQFTANAGANFNWYPHQQIPSSEAQVREVRNST